MIAFILSDVCCARSLFGNRCLPLQDDVGVLDTYLHSGLVQSGAFMRSLTRGL